MRSYFFQALFSFVSTLCIDSVKVKNDNNLWFKPCFTPKVSWSKTYVCIDILDLASWYSSWPHFPKHSEELCEYKSTCFNLIWSLYLMSATPKLCCTKLISDKITSQICCWLVSHLHILICKFSTSYSLAIEQLPQIRDVLCAMCFL